jgi:hypothetical protein
MKIYLVNIMIIVLLYIEYIVQVNITIMDTRIQWYKLYRNKNKNK